MNIETADDFADAERNAKKEKNGLRKRGVLMLALFLATVGTVIAVISQR